VSLHDIERVSITLLMDNITDRLLTSSAHAERPPMVEEEKFLPPPIAEHGFSAVIEIHYHDHKMKKKISNRFLFDTGVSENGIIFNADLLGVDLTNIEAINLRSPGPFCRFVKCHEADLKTAQSNRSS